MTYPRDEWALRADAYRVGGDVAFDLLGAVLVGMVVAIRPGAGGVPRLQILWRGEASCWTLPASCPHLTALEDGAADHLIGRRATVRGG